MKAGHITNAATVEGTAPDGKDVDASDTATVTFVPAPGISLAKTADPDTYGKPGETITYIYVVTNSGNVPLSGITLTTASSARSSARRPRWMQASPWSARRRM